MCVYVQRFTYACQNVIDISKFYFANGVSFDALSFLQSWIILRGAVSSAVYFPVFCAHRLYVYIAAWYPCYE